MTSIQKTINQSGIYLYRTKSLFVDEKSPVEDRVFFLLFFAMEQFKFEMLWSNATKE